MSVAEAARRLAPTVQVDEDQDVVRWSDGGEQRATVLHDDAALSAVPGLYEAVSVEHLDSGSPALLAAALGEVLPPAARPGRRVLDVGAGTGLAGEHRVTGGSAPVCAVDLEAAGAGAVLRDRPSCHRGARAHDLLAPTADDRGWLAEVAPDVVTVTVAPDLATSRDLVDHAAVLLGPRLVERARRAGTHRRTGSGEGLSVSALVLERT